LIEFYVIVFLICKDENIFHINDIISHFICFYYKHNKSKRKTEKGKKGENKKNKQRNKYKIRNKKEKQKKANKIENEYLFFLFFVN